MARFKWRDEVAPDSVRTEFFYHRAEIDVVGGVVEIPDDDVDTCESFRYRYYDEITVEVATSDTEEAHEIVEEAHEITE